MIIGSRFNGPPGSANGGYSAGRFAHALAGEAAAEVTLRRPPPLDVPLLLDGWTVHDPAGELVAEVRPIDPFATEAVPAVAWPAAVEAATRYAGFAEHPFPTCYVCGPERADGLRIFPGRLPDGGTAAPFVVPDDVQPATVWAALDCPGGWSVIAPGRPYVLGRLAVVVEALPTAGDHCVVTGRTETTQGRKASVRSTLYGPAGDRLAYARATWIAV